MDQILKFIQKDMTIDEIVDFMGETEDSVRGRAIIDKVKTLDKPYLPFP